MANSKISSNIKKLRTEKGYSLEKVARLADLSLNTVMRVESGVNKNPTIETKPPLGRLLLKSNKPSVPNNTTTRNFTGSDASIKLTCRISQHFLLDRFTRIKACHIVVRQRTT